MKLAFQLQIIGRICENQVNRIRRQRVHHFDAIALENLVQWKWHSRIGWRHRTLCRCHIYLPLSRTIVGLIGCTQSESKVIRRQTLFESISYDFFLIQDIVYRFERTSMVWGHAKVG